MGRLRYRHIGFSGTRQGMSPRQLSAVYDLICERLSAGVAIGAWYLHHGECMGADAQAHAIGRELGMRLIGHPPTDDRWQALDLTAFFKRRSPADYLVRNRHIVDEAGELIAAPLANEAQSPGTWSTVRYARRSRRRVTIIWPDGRVEKSA
jgi:hypothetical protein